MEEVPRRTSLVPLAFPCFVLRLIGWETKNVLDYQGRAGDHFHCTVEPSPGHIRCRKFSLAHPNPGKRSTENFTQNLRHLWQRKTEKKFTSALCRAAALMNVIDVISEPFAREFLGGRFGYFLFFFSSGRKKREPEAPGGGWGFGREKTPRIAFLYNKTPQHWVFGAVALPFSQAYLETQQRCRFRLTLVAYGSISQADTPSSWHTKQ